MGSVVVQKSVNLSYAAAVAYLILDRIT